MSNIFPTKTFLNLNLVDNTADLSKPVSTAQGVAIAATSVIQIASTTNVSGAALASTVLTFGSGISLTTHIPLFYVVKYVSGALGIGVVKMKNSIADLTALSALVTLTSTQEVFIGNSVLATMVNSGNISVEVTTASLAASVFNVYVYGILRP